MANCKAKIKKGMKGSHNGKGRWERTEILKSDSKKARRREGKQQTKEE